MFSKWVTSLTFVAATLTPAQNLRLSGEAADILAMQVLLRGPIRGGYPDHYCSAVF